MMTIYPSWRWDERKCQAFCTCGARDVLGVLRGVEEIEFDAATCPLCSWHLIMKPNPVQVADGELGEVGREFGERALANGTLTVTDIRTGLASACTLPQYT
ncbi:MAG: hypothetical protein WBW31_25200 [Candidatus Sulfotelmatobacter sp.]